jgi:hypothetical protein
VNSCTTTVYIYILVINALPVELHCHPICQIGLARKRSRNSNIKGTARRVVSKTPTLIAKKPSKTRDDLCDHITEGEPDEAIITEGFFDDEMARATSMRDEYVREYAKHSSLRAHFCGCRL